MTPAKFLATTFWASDVGRCPPLPGLSGGVAPNGPVTGHFAPPGQGLTPGARMAARRVSFGLLAV